MISRFTERVLPNQKLSKGILNSEGFAFCALADYYNISLILESGVANGGSTIIWCKYFPSDCWVKICGFDISLPEAALSLSNKYTNLQLVEVDSTKIFRILLHCTPQERVAIFIDGPKGERAVDLAKYCYQFPQVKMISIHDMYRAHYGQPLAGRLALQQWIDKENLQSFYTDKPWFYEAYGNMDVDNDGQPLQPHSKYVCEEYGGYGPTVGFILK